MSHFYGSVTGNARTPATRQGTRDSGLDAHIRSWNRGVRVIASHDAEHGVDVFDVYLTGGSNNPAAGKHVGTFTWTQGDK